MLQRYDRLRTPANAACTAVAALALLAVGLVAPLMTVTVLGEPESHGIVSGIGALRASGHAGLAALLAVFSVAFPVVKLALVIVAAGTLGSLGPGDPAPLVRIAEATGKYSMLDVLVVAVLVAAFQSQEHLQIEADWGLWTFAAAIALSIVSTWLLPPSAGRKPRLDGRTSIMSRRSLFTGIGLVVAAAACASTGWSLAARTPPPIRAIIVAPRTAIGLPSLDVPDVFVVLVDERGASWRSATVDDAVLGDGLEIPVDAAPARDAPEAGAGFDPRRVVRAEVWDKGLRDGEGFLGDSLLDRFRIVDGQGTGERYRARCEYVSETSGKTSTGLLLGSAAGAVIGLAMIARGLARPSESGVKAGSGSGADSGGDGR